MVTQDERRQLIGDITELQKEMTRHIAPDRAIPLLASSLTMQQFKTLLILSAGDALPGHELAERLGVRLGTVTGIVDRLVAQDLLRRDEDPRDRRIRRVSLTAAGAALIAEITDDGLTAFRELLEDLDLDTLRQCREVVQALLDAAVHKRAATGA